ncbi:MAG: transporter [Hyphomicrobiaceae bacterium]|jgi:hypothetical protein
MTSPQSLTRSSWTVAACLWAVVCVCGPVWAFDISDPEVEKGQHKIETMHVGQSGFPTGSTGNTRNIQSLGYSYGLTDFWQLKGGLIGDRLDDRDWRVGVAFVESTLEIVDIKKTGIGLAWFSAVAGAVSDDATNTVLFGPIIKFAYDRFSLTLNPFLDKSFGQNHEDGIAFVYGWQANAAIGNGVTLSLAGFGKIDDIGHAPSASQQEHIIGPLVGYEFEVTDKRTMAMELGVFFGLTEATADTAFKGKLSYSF